MLILYESKINKNTKAIIPTQLNGRAVKMDIDAFGKEV